MHAIRLLGSITLWIAALIGLVAGGVWIAGRLDYIQPMIVISGSMEPGIMTGELIVGRSMATDQVEVGDVLSLPSSFTGKLVTHRVISIAPDGDAWEVHMKGDANDEPDAEVYLVGNQVWTPWIRVPQGGKVVSKVMEPAVAMPIILALVALLGISLLDGPPRKVVRTVVRRIRRDPRVDELDEELAAVGVDVARLRSMDDLDLQLFALGIDLADATPSPTGDDERTTHIAGVRSSQRDDPTDPTDRTAHDERTTHIAVVHSSQRDDATAHTAHDERNTRLAGVRSSRAEEPVGDEGGHGLWDFQLPASDAIQQVRTPNAPVATEPGGREPDEHDPEEFRPGGLGPGEHEPAAHEPGRREPSLSG